MSDFYKDRDVVAIAVESLHSESWHQLADALEATVAALRQEVERLRAVLSWITGACVDELPHAEISAAVDRALATQDTPNGVLLMPPATYKDGVWTATQDTPNAG